MRFHKGNTDNRIATGMVLWGTGACGLNLTQTETVPCPVAPTFYSLHISSLAIDNHQFMVCFGFFFFFLSLLSHRLLQNWINHKLYDPGNSIWVGLKRQLWTTRADSALPSKQKTQFHLVDIKATWVDENSTFLVYSHIRVCFNIH